MKLSKRTTLVWLGLLLITSFTLFSCGKKISPQAAKQTRLDWNLKTLVGAYQAADYDDPKWDEAATNALTEFARARSLAVDLDENWAEIIGTNCAAAIKAGCDDPMIRYLYIRNYMSQTNTAKDFADAFCKVEADMQQSSYPPIRKFYASLRALEQVYHAYGSKADRETTSQLADDIVENLRQALDDKTMPAEEAYEACSQGLYELSGGKKRYEDCYQQIEQPLFKNWPKESVSWLLKGEAYTEMAWQARGNDTVDKVTEEGGKLFRERLATAEKSLNEAWKLNPKDVRIPHSMMTVELGQGKGRDTMELWFDRAMTINPNDYAACASKLYYLEPKWYGSVEEMLKFGRECVTNTAWGGHIPLILMDAHRTIYSSYIDDSVKEDYWKQPEVWADIKAAFDRFFELNPDAVSWYHNYAWYAYHAEQWDALNEIIPKLGPINYSYFGGKDEFDKMIELAKEHTGKTSTAP